MGRSKIDFKKFTGHLTDNIWQNWCEQNVTVVPQTFGQTRQIHEPRTNVDLRGSAPGCARRGQKKRRFGRGKCSHRFVKRWRFNIILWMIYEQSIKIKKRSLKTQEWFNVYNVLYCTAVCSIVDSTSLPHRTVLIAMLFEKAGCRHNLTSARGRLFVLKHRLFFTPENSSDTPALPPETGRTALKCSKGSDFFYGFFFAPHTIWQAGPFWLWKHIGPMESLVTFILVIFSSFRLFDQGRHDRIFVLMENKDKEGKTKTASSLPTSNPVANPVARCAREFRAALGHFKYRNPKNIWVNKDPFEKNTGK